MSAVPVGYEAFHSKRRKGVTLLCFLLASSIAMGITVFVDSYSMYRWDEYLDVGEVHLVIRGSVDLSSYEEGVRNLGAVTRAAFLRSSYGEIALPENATPEESAFVDWGTVIAPDQDFFDTYPSFIELESGRLPESGSEVAVPYELHVFAELEINDSVDVTVSGTTYVELEVVGFYSQQMIGSYSPLGYYPEFESIAILSELPTYLHYNNDLIMASIDKSPISPFTPQYSLAYVNTINEQVRQLDPTYGPPRFSSSLYPQSLLGAGISSYILWVQTTRIGQVVRSMSVFLLAALVIFLAIRYNTNERRFERNMLISRGASPSDLDSAVNREVFILSLISCIAGIPLGAIFSRIAMASSGFFRIGLSKAITEPFLISIESIIISTVVGMALPMVTLAGYRSIYSTKKRVEDHPGKLSKLVRGLAFIRWDVLVVGVSSLLLLLIYSGGPATTSLLMFLQPVPLALFLGVSSLAIKALRGGSRVFSRVLKRPLGAVPTSVGIRRVGKSASSAGAAMMVLVLAICLSWSSAIVDLSLPATKTNQARLDIGADITFALDPEEAGLWPDFTDNVTSIDGVYSIDMTAEVRLSLTADESGFSTFFAVSPDDYSRIGFDYRGQRLNQSSFRNLLVELGNTLDGAIITSDLAQMYDLTAGDSLRASDLDSDDPQTHEFRVLGVVTALPKMPEVEYPWWAEPYDGYYYRSILAGQRRIMINREYVSTLMNITESAQSYLCVRTEKGANGTAIAEEALLSGGEKVLFNGVWNAVDKSVSELVEDTAYSMERAIDTMLTVLTVGTILAAFALYAAEGVRTRKREIALLRSMGAEKRLIVSAQAAEMFVLIVFGLFLLIGYAPLFLGSSVIVSVNMTLASNQIYPVSAFLVVPWPTMALVLLFFIVLTLVFIVVVALVSSRIHLASALNATWAEAGPYGGDV